MANREEGAAAPNQRQGQEQPQHQDAVGQRHIHFNWSNFKPEFSEKPEEDAEGPLLCSNDWMEAHRFNEDIRIQRFCLTLLREARLWYQSLEPLGETTWAQLQNLFRQRYSKLGSTHEQLFHAWRSFTFDERPFKPQIYKSRGQNRPFGQERYQPRSNDRNGLWHRQ